MKPTLTVEISLRLIDYFFYIDLLIFSIDALHVGDLITQFSPSNGPRNFFAEILIIERVILTFAKQYIFAFFELYLTIESAI